MARRDLPEVNASSMADIAFLLLTFFLIATTLNRDEGIMRTVPDPNDPPKDVPKNERNTYRIMVNKLGQIQINGKNATMSEIQPGVVEFVDNGGGPSLIDGEICSYCKGKRDPSSSDTPRDAIISLELDNATPYNYFYTVENYVDMAFNELRNTYSKDHFQMSYTDLMTRAEAEGDNGTEYSDKLKEVQSAYPKIIAKARLKSN